MRCRVEEKCLPSMRWCCSSDPHMSARVAVDASLERKYSSLNRSWENALKDDSYFVECVLCMKSWAKIEPLNKLEILSCISTDNKYFHS